MLRALPEMNTNYDPPRAWVCGTSAAHECDGQVVGAIGSIPVCDAGADAEIAQRAENDRLLREFLASEEGQEMLRDEIRQLEHERRHA